MSASYGCGINPLRGQNNVQGGGDMGALPDRLPGFQHVEDTRLRARFEGLGRGRSRRGGAGTVAACSMPWSAVTFTALYVIGENPVAVGG